MAHSFAAVRHADLRLLPIIIAQLAALGSGACSSVCPIGAVRRAGSESRVGASFAAVAAVYARLARRKRR
jgi:hypothetical protein